MYRSLARLDKCQFLGEVGKQICCLPSHRILAVWSIRHCARSIQSFHSRLALLACLAPPPTASLSFQNGPPSSRRCWSYRRKGARMKKLQRVLSLSILLSLSRSEEGKVHSRKIGSDASAPPPRCAPHANQYVRWLQKNNEQPALRTLVRKCQFGQSAGLSPAW